MQSSTFIITCGIAGSGKTFVRGCRFLVDRFLKDNQDGKHISNLPLAVDVIAEHVAERDSRIIEDVEAQIVLIPDVVMKRWENEESGPWEYFAGDDLTDCHIAIDEAHRVCGSKHSKEHIKRWQLWIGELRHQGAACEFITQAESKLPREIRDEAGLMYFLEDRAYRRDAFFSIPYSDWSELSACFTRRYSSAFCVHEVRDIGGRKQKFDGKPAIIERDPFYFKFYDSYSAPNENAKGAKEKKYEFQKRSRIGLILWFMKKNVLNFLFSKPAAILLVIALFVSGTIPRIFNSVITSFVGSGPSLSPEEERIQELEGIVKRLSTAVEAKESLLLKYESGHQSRIIEKVNNDMLKRRNEIVGVFGNVIHLKQGGRVILNEEIKNGPLKGLAVSDIVPGKYLVRLSDGTAISYFETTKIQGTVQKNSFGKRKDQYAVARGSKNNIFPSTRNATASRSSGTQFNNWKDIDSGTGLRNDFNNSRVAPSNIRGRAQGYQQTFGRTGNSFR